MTNATAEGTTSHFIIDKSNSDEAESGSELPDCFEEL